MTKKIQILGLTTLFLVALTSCSDDSKIIADAPSYGDIAKDTVVFKNEEDKELTVTNKELYDRLKFKYGYNLANYIIRNEVLYKKTDKEKQDIYNNNKREINKKILKDIFDTEDLNILKLYADNTINKDQTRVDEGVGKIQNFIYKKSEEGIISAENDYKFDILTDPTNKELYIEFKNIDYTSRIIEPYLTEEIEKEIITKIIKDNSDKSSVYSYKEQKEVLNPTLTDKPAMEKYFNDEYRTFYDANGIILKYKSKNEALAAKKRALNKALQTEITDLNKEQIFINLFNEYYINEEEMTDIATDHRAHVLYDKKEKDTPIKEIENKYLKDLKNGEFTSEPVIIDDKETVYMLYRKEVKYFIGADNEDLIPAGKLPANITPESKKYQKMVDFYIKEKVKDDKIIFFYETNILGEKELKIHDVFLEEAFKKDNPDSYFKINNKDRNSALVLEGKDFKLKPEDFYKELKKLNVTEAVYEIILNKKLAKNEENLLSKKEQEEAKDKIKDDIRALKNEINSNSTEYDSTIGEKNYLFIKHGFYDEEELETHLYQEKLKEKFLEKIFYESWATDKHEVSDVALKLFQMLKKSGEKNYSDVHSFKMDIQHLLLYVDTNSDGDADDMNVFLSGLSGEEKTQFEKVVKEEYTKIIKVYEYKMINEKKMTIDTLKEIADLFNTRTAVKLGLETITFNSHGYNIYLKAENLAEKGFIDNKNVNDYVAPFKKFIQNIAKYLENDTNKIKELQIDDVEKKDNHNKHAKLISDNKQITNSTFELTDLCATQFGYHLIALQNYIPWYPNRVNENDLFKDTDEKLYKISITADNSEEEDKDKKDKKEDLVYIKDRFFNDNGEKPEMTPKQVLLYLAAKKKSLSINYKLEKVLETRLESVIDHYSSKDFQTFTAYFSYVKDNELLDNEIKTYNKTEEARILKYKGTDYKVGSAFEEWYNLSNIDTFKRK